MTMYGFSDGCTFLPALTSYFPSISTCTSKEFIIEALKPPSRTCHSRTSTWVHLQDNSLHTIEVQHTCEGSARTAIGWDAPNSRPLPRLRHRGSCLWCSAEWTGRRAALHTLTSLDGARRRSKCGPHLLSLWELPQRSFWTKPSSRTIWNRFTWRHRL